MRVVGFCNKERVGGSVQTPGAGGGLSHRLVGPRAAQLRVSTIGLESSHPNEHGRLSSGKHIGSSHLTATLDGGAYREAGLVPATRNKQVGLGLRRSQCGRGFLRISW